MLKSRDERIEDLILKVAQGFQVAEVTEEFVEVDGEMKLTKRKKTKKDVPPDWKALQLLLGNRVGDVDFSALSDEDLERERARLLAQLAAASEGAAGVADGVVGAGEAKKAAKAKRATARKKKPTVLNGGIDEP